MVDAEKHPLFGSEQMKKYAILLTILTVSMLFLTACVQQHDKPAGKEGAEAPSMTPTAVPTATMSPTPSPSPTPTNTPTPTPSPSPTPTPTPKVVTMLTAGDALLHQTVINSGIKEDGTINYDHFFRFLADDIQNADIAVINQETVLGGTHYPYAGYPKFNSPLAIGDAERKVGFDVILHANNHITDYGIEGLMLTLDYWEQFPEITVLGIRRTEEEYDDIKVIEKNGIKIAMLNYTYGLNVGTSGKWYTVSSFDYEVAKRQIAKAKEISDFVVVFPHWGIEYVYEPPQEVKDQAAFYLEQEVDLVIGNHAHVIQPVEWLEKENGHRMLVYYSIGNYISSMDYTNTMLSMLAKVTITQDETGTYISDAEAEPIVTHYERTADRSFGVYRLSEYTEELAARHFIKPDRRGADMSLAKLKEIAKMVLGEWYTLED